MSGQAIVRYLRAVNHQPISAQLRNPLDPATVSDLTEALRNVRLDGEVGKTCRRLIRAIARWAGARGAVTRGLVPVRGSDQRLDLCLDFEGGRVAIDIDRHGEVIATEQLARALKVGWHPLWIRWRSPQIAQPPGVVIVDLPARAVSPAQSLLARLFPEKQFDGIPDERVWSFVALLGPGRRRLIEIVELRAGRTGEPMTLDQTAAELFRIGRTARRLSRERIRQLEAKAFRMLRHPSRSRHLFKESQSSAGTARPNEPRHAPRPPAEHAHENRTSSLGDRLPTIEAQPAATRVASAEQLTLADLRLPARSNNALSRNGLTVRQILNCSDDALLRLRNFGRASLRELDQRLAELGMSRASPPAGAETSQRAVTPGAQLGKHGLVSRHAGPGNRSERAPLPGGSSGKRSIQPATTRMVLAITLMDGRRDQLGGRLESTLVSVLSSLPRDGLTPTQLAHILRGSPGPQTQQVIHRYGIRDAGSFASLPFPELREQILRAAESRPETFAIRIRDVANDQRRND